MIIYFPKKIEFMTDGGTHAKWYKYLWLKKCELELRLKKLKLYETRSWNSFFVNGNITGPIIGTIRRI